MLFALLGSLFWEAFELPTSGSKQAVAIRSTASGGAILYIIKLSIVG